jgi:hypothetical protein
MSLILGIVASKEIVREIGCELYGVLNLLNEFVKLDHLAMVQHLSSDLLFLCQGWSVLVQHQYIMR